ncbi:MAG: hypothetical protein GX424_04230 [Clostridiales bacterium]|jgi:hypothetical protein|nr:hypothetical protein [Clostridiales bacterium]
MFGIFGGYLHPAMIAIGLVPIGSYAAIRNNPAFGKYAACAALSLNSLYSVCAAALFLIGQPFSGLSVFALIVAVAVDVWLVRCAVLLLRES